MITNHENSFQNLLGEKADQREEVLLHKHITSETAPCFIWHTSRDDVVPVENSLVLALALAKHGVPFEAHIYPEGGHGLSLANEITKGENEAMVVVKCQDWIEKAIDWVRALK